MVSGACCPSLSSSRESSAVDSGMGVLASGRQERTGASSPQPAAPDQHSSRALRPSRTRYPPAETATAEPSRSSIEAGRRNALVRAAESVGPAVVSISVVQTRYVRGRPRRIPSASSSTAIMPGPLYAQQIPELSAAAVIVDRAGVILTNEHVVREAEQIKVTLTDGRTFDARLVGSDPNYDLAVLKINGENLPVAPLGDSDDILVGRVGHRHRQPVRLPPERPPADRHGRGDQRHRPRHQASRATDRHLQEHDPDRRGDQPGELRRAAGQRRRER